MKRRVLFTFLAFVAVTLSVDAQETVQDTSARKSNVVFGVEPIRVKPVTSKPKTRPAHEFTAKPEVYKDPNSGTKPRSNSTQTPGVKKNN